MQQGIHIVERPALAGVLDASAPTRVGALDLVRLVEGHLPEPAAGEPLVVEGLAALLDAADDEAEDVLRVLRRCVHDARRFFEYSRVPLVVVADGALSDEGEGLSMEGGRGRWSLAPLVGHGPRRQSGHDGWWWSPQLD